MVILKLQMGFEHRLSIMQALQNIYVVNRHATLYGDAIPGLVETSGLQEFGYSERLGQRNPDGTYPDLYGYRYHTKRKGRDEYTYDFIVADAKQANLWKKAGTWTFYPDRMLLNRARTFCLRDVYPDVLKGLQTTEEARDIQDAEFEVENAKPEYQINLPEHIPDDTKPVVDAEGNQHWGGKVYGPKGYFVRLEVEQAAPQQDIPQAPSKRPYYRKDNVPAVETQAAQSDKPENIPPFETENAAYTGPDEKGRYTQGKYVYSGDLMPLGTVEEIAETDKASEDFKLKG